MRSNLDENPQKVAQKKEKEKKSIHTINDILRDPLEFLYFFPFSSETIHLKGLNREWQNRFYRFGSARSREQRDASNPTSAFPFRWKI